MGGGGVSSDYFVSTTVMVVLLLGLWLLLGFDNKHSGSFLFSNLEILI